MNTCETCKYNNESITDERCYSCSTVLRENWEPMKKEIEIEDAFKTFNIEEAKQKTKIKDSGSRTEFETGAVRDMHEGKGRCDLLPPNALLRLARHFEEGALKYSDRNWEAGIPTHSFIDSGLRHIFKYMAGEKDEDHLIAAVWNLVCLVETEIKRPEMQDIPARMVQK